MILAYLPCFGTLFAVFIPEITVIPIQALEIALLYALVNGTIEELFWRGVLKNMKYQGGFATLVGGTVFMGFLWDLLHIRQSLFE
ncbi:type II CAAX prenyl endopeptidase Rce1 family protein [Marasmitruncus massiliensis]|uniref:CPBP family glutamic-type intramembrane protease n=1 Tax=Marasmitruncus massiliensis TaxID=1944642 RepID=UPI000C7A5558